MPAVFPRHRIAVWRARPPAAASRQAPASQEQPAADLWLCDAEVCHARAALGVQQDVLRLEVSVNDVRVEVVHSGSDVLRELQDAGPPEVPPTVPCPGGRATEQQARVRR